MPEEFGDTPELDTVVHETAWGTWLVPASKALASAERALGEAGRGGVSQRLKRGLERLEVDARFDLVLIDCPPGMTPLTMNALVAGNSVLVPTQLDFLSVAGLAVLTETVQEVREYDNPDLSYLGIVGTQVDERTRHAREIRDQLEQLFGSQAGGVLCRTTIRQSTRVRDAHAAGIAVGRFDPQHPVSADYRALAKELAVRATRPRNRSDAMNSKRADAGAAVAGLFSNSSATGGLARRVPEPSAHVSLAPVDRTQRLRQGVELDEHRRLTNRT